MNLFTEEAIDDVLTKLLLGSRFLRPDDDLVPASASAICQRRRQLGVMPLVALFREVCRPLATPTTQDAFLRGWRLMAIDGTTEDVPDILPTPNILDVRMADEATALFPKCGRCTCASVELMPSAMLGFGRSPVRNVRWFTNVTFR